MHALKWWKASTRMFFEGEAAGGSPSGSDGGSGSGSASPASPAPSSGDGGVSGSSTSSSDGGGGASSPAATPSSSDSNEVDWSMLGSTDDLDQIEIPPASPTPTPAAPTAPKPTAQPAATPTPPQPVQPETPAAAPPAAATPTQPAPQEAQSPVVQLSPSDPLGIAQALEANRDASLAHLAQTRFALSNEDIAELEDNAAAFVPKMMARVHHEAQVSMMKFLAQAVPGMMKQFQTVNAANTEAEDQFFSAHKALGLDKTNKQHREVAFRIASIYRRANPQMPMEQLIADVGPMVAMSLKLPMVPGGAPAAPVPGSPQPVASRPAPTGFRPAVNGGGGASPTPEPENEWAGLGRDYD